MTAQKKSKKRKIVLFLLILIAVLTAMWFLFLKDFLRDNIKLSPDNLFPFGTPSNREPVTTPNEEQAPVGGGVRPDDFKPIERDRLRLISETPTAGFTHIVSDLFYPSQTSIETYNKARGDIAVEDLEVIRSPRLRVVEQKQGDIYDVTVHNSLNKLYIAQNNIPGVWESFISGNNANFLTIRLYDKRTTNIETFIGYIRPDFQPLYCDIPTKEISTTEPHPGIAGTKRILSKIYGYTNTISDIFDEETATNWEEVLFNLSIEKDQDKEILSLEALEKIGNLCREKASEVKTLLPHPIRGDFIDVDIEQVSPSNDSTELFTLKKSNKEYEGNLISLDNPEKDNLVFLSNFGEWLPQLTNRESVFLQTKPSYQIEGHLYHLETKTNQFKKIIGDSWGLTTSISPNEQFVIFSETNKNTDRTQTKIINLQTREERLLSFVTLADKCGWSSDSSFAICGAPRNGVGENQPDNWYKGLTRNSDKVWLVNAETLGSYEIFDPEKEKGKNLDIHKLLIDPYENNYVYFIDKSTNYLWSLEIDDITLLD